MLENKYIALEWRKQMIPHFSVLDQSVTPEVRFKFNPAKPVLEFEIFWALEAIKSTKRMK